MIALPRAATLLILALSSGAGARGSDWLQVLRGYDQRAATLGFRLAVAARPWCARSAPLWGGDLGAVSQFGRDDQAAARRSLGLTDAPVLTAVVPDGPADRAGLRVGDELVAVDGAPVTTEGAGLADSPAHADAATRQLGDALAGGVATLTVRRAGNLVTVRLVGQPGCAVRWIVSSRDGVGAASDGVDVDLPVGLFRFAPDDHELAAVAAHELAHVVFQDTRPRPRTVADRRREEDDADALGVVLMARAGYDPAAAVRFWTRFRAADRFGFLRAPTHRSTAGRVRLIRATVARLGEAGGADAVAKELLAPER